MSATWKWSVTDDPSPSDVDAIEQGVFRFGRAQAVDGNARPLAVFVREGDRMVAGASGRTEYSRLFVNYLWVEESLRGQGLGPTVLIAMERAGRARGCGDALLETLSDDNAVLYERCGYETVAKVARYVGPFTKYVMIKLLSD